MEEELLHNVFPTLPVKNLSRSLDWYVKVLQFEHLRTMPEHKEPIWSHLRWSDHAEILLVAQGAKEDFEDVDASDVDLTFYVEPGMLDKLAAHIKSCGESLISGPQKRPWNARELMIADPDGYRLTFSEVLKETAP